MENRPILVVLLLSCVTIGTTHALESHVDLVGGVEYSDNANQNRNDGSSEIEERVGVGLTILENLPNLYVDGQYTASAVNYGRDTSSNQTVVVGRSSLVWTPLPNRFSWSLDHQIEDSRRDSRQNDIPDNRETRNIVNTGPLFSLGISPVDVLSAGVTYSIVRFEDSEDSDSDRITGQLSWNHQLNATRSLGTTVQYADVKFDNDANDITDNDIDGLIDNGTNDLTDNGEDDLEIYSAFFTFATQLPNGQYNLQLGGNRVERSTGDDNDGVYFVLAYDNIFRGNPISITASRRLSDSSLGSGINAASGIGSRANDTNFDVADVVEITRVALSYSMFQFCQGCELGTELSYNKLDYDTEPRDEDSIRLTTRFRYALNNHWGVIGGLDYEHVEFTNNDAKDNNSSVTLGSDYQFSERFVVTLLATHERRDGNEDDREFTGNRVTLSVVYPIW
ncbi:MAG: hypothetical protein ACR2P1_12465 [Pseudomonadales bacterium]